jgi:hypothetical protein
MNDDQYLAYFQSPPLSDEAAAQILEFLYDLALRFESAYAGQIRRFHHPEIEIPGPDPRQQNLFDDDPPF